MSLFFFSSRRRHPSCYRDWSSDVCSSDLPSLVQIPCLSGKIQGISWFQAPVWPFSIRSRTLYQCFVRRFPNQWIREFFRENRERNSVNRDRKNVGVCQGQALCRQS